MLAEVHERAEAHYSQGFDQPLHPMGHRPKQDTPYTEAEIAQFHLLLHEQARRSKESLRLYEPLPFQEGFHTSDAPERSIRGSNRSGKTLSAAVEFARAVTGQDPYGKYPRTGRAIIVGKDEKHCGEVLFRKLFKPGAFRVIRDAASRQWRPFNPTLDDHRRKERRNAPPLIPNRFYSDKDISWSKKREEIPKKIVVNAGKDTEWEIYFFSSLGEAPQGWDVDVVWFDEEIEHPSWYPEMAARLVDRSEYHEDQGRWIGGKFFWSATPQAGTIQLFKIHQRADDERGSPTPRVTEHTATLFDNDYLSNKAKQAFVDKLGDNEDEARVRIYGEFALLGMRVYSDFFPKGAHGCDPFEIPHDWCRYISIDPGRQVCAVLFMAIPPPGTTHSHHVFAYDELYIKRCSAERLAELLYHKISGIPIYEALIDGHAGRITEMGSGRTVEQQYREAMEKKHIRFEKSNSVQFTWGDDDIMAGIEAVRSLLSIRDGRARLQVFRGRCPNLVKEMEEYAYKKDVASGTVTDKPLAINNHLCDTLRYAASHGLPYRRPKNKKRRGNYAFQYLEDKKRRKAGRSGHGSAVRIG